jgi:hypothetical protein
MRFFSVKLGLKGSEPPIACQDCSLLPTNEVLL